MTTQSYVQTPCAFFRPGSKILRRQKHDNPRETNKLTLAIERACL